MIESVAGAVGAVVLLAGLTMASIGLFGMLRKPSIFEQLHAAGLVTGPALILVLLASLASGSAETASSAFLVGVFILVTASLSTHAIALAAWQLGSGSGPGEGEDGSAAGTPGETDLAGRAMRVLVAHDGSAGADVATSLVASLAWPDATAIRVIGVTEGDLQPLPAAVETLPGLEEPSPVDLRAALEAAVRSLQRPGLVVDHVARPGDPAATLAHEAETFRAHLLVTGTRGLGRLETIFAGSVAAAVVDAAPCPVLVARGPAVKQVLLATDGSASSAAATDIVARWPLFAEVPIDVLSVATAVSQYGDPPTGAGMREAVETARQQRIADSAARQLRDAGRRAVPHVRTGEAAAQIAHVAAARSVDLVVLGSRGRTGLTRTLLGSVARDVLSSARASVLVVRD